MTHDEDFQEKAMSKSQLWLPNGKEVNIVYDCTEAQFDKAVRRWKKGKDLSGEALCRQIHKIKPYCIAVTEEQFQEAIKEALTTEEAMQPHQVGSKLGII